MRRCLFLEAPQVLVNKNFSNVKDDKTIGGGLQRME